ncbi:tissue alpha-L-fucosidase-like [Pectinophora gossypiella]|uniref:tissue alpha-L-fucosidase-like n=1 Tax=Pectinophora gossypiella TaxID=13191 RepID=UPI00214E29F2|nr:tissue alpha-L-fucosidase-like [Pectinophora gossypiella]
MRVLMSFTFVFFLFLLTYVNPQHRQKSKKPSKIVIVDDKTPEDQAHELEWAELDNRTLPEWFDRVKIGIFVHWGIYSVPATHNEWFLYFWKTSYPEEVNYMKKYFRPNFTYEDFAPYFTAEYFDADEWARFFVKSGAKYVVLTSKHHDGFTLFPSKQSRGWNSVRLGPHRDIVGELGAAVKLQGLKYGIYYSLLEWYHQDYLEDKEAKFKKYTYRDTKVWPEIKQLVNKYEPAILWFDGGWETSDVYWNATGLLKWLYNESPVKDYVVVNDRLGNNAQYLHGDFYNGPDRHDPQILQKHKWENAFTLDLTSWGYRSQMKEKDVMTVQNMLHLLIRTVSCGGNFLVNIGPSREGIIVKIFQDRLLALGEWLQINGEAIYYSSPWRYQRDTRNKHVWYTCNKVPYNALDPTATPLAPDTIKAIYAMFTPYPTNHKLTIKDISPLLKSAEYQVMMLGETNILNWTVIHDNAIIRLPEKTKSQNAWALKFFKTHEVEVNVTSATHLPGKIE